MKTKTKLLVWAWLLLAASILIPYQAKAIQDFWTISIANPDDPTEWITIMDRNLGATSNDITSKDSFGYHYQWWNNYWFAQWCFSQGCNDSVTEASMDADTIWLIWNDSYNNSGYYWPIFIKSDFSYSYRRDGSYHNWLWWWTWDNPSNNWWAKQTNSEDRQWPCPEGYHVPSAWEWWLLVKYWWNTYDENNLVNGWDGFYYISWDTAADFKIYFKLPFAGIRSEDNALLYNQGRYGEYWSSSPNGNAYLTDEYWEDRIHIFNTFGIPKWNTGIPNRWLSIRCFKDTYEPTNSSSTPQTCSSMDSANVTHTINDWIITLHWDEIQGDFVDVSIYWDEERWYLPEGTVNMKDKKFDYNIIRSGEHKFMLRNWCRNFYYTVNVNTAQAFSQELQEAFARAYENWIISDTNINNAWLYYYMDNLELADIMNKFAENILWLQPNTSLQCSFGDISTYIGTDQETLTRYQEILEKSCQLWLIPRNKIENPAPIQDANRAIFGTALSRALWWNQNEWWDPYYSGHLNALKAAWIITQIDNPERRYEEKWYVLMILMRVSKSNSDETSKYDVNGDGKVDKWDIQAVTNCMAWSSNNPKCDVDGDWTPGIWDIVAITNHMSDNSWNWNNSNNSNTQNNTTAKEIAKWYSWWGGRRSSNTSKDSWWNSTTKTDNDTHNSTNVKTSNSKNNDKWNTITNTNKRPIDYMVPTINKIEYNEWDPKEVLENWFTREQNNAYNFAYANWITTIKNIEKANLSWAMTRAAMAKMLSNYAINVLGKEPDKSKTPHFWDISKETDKQYDNWITLAYQLWIMWVWTKNFRPYDSVTRKEFATILSRMLYNTEDWTWKTKYYEPHIAKLYDRWIISKTNPEIIEKRGNVMTMLMRSAK